jgi:hypothetical protein
MPSCIFLWADTSRRIGVRTSHEGFEVEMIRT